jgi:hypothetical protein
MVGAVHPIERLRYVARSTGAPQELLVRETAGALAAFRDDPTALVTACRRIVSRQLSCGALWWLCSRMLVAADPMAEARAAVVEIEDDRTPRSLAAALPDDVTVLVLGWQSQVAGGLARRGDVEVLVVDVLGEASAFVRHLESRDVEALEVPVSGLGAAAAEADLVIVEASAFGPDAFLAASGSRAAAAVAHHAGIPVWAVVGVGRVLPARVWDALVSRLDAHDDRWDLDDEVVPVDLVDHVVGPKGLETSADTILRTDCPIAPELFKPDIT